MFPLTVDLSELPTALSEVLGIDVYSAGILATLLFLMLTLFPALLVTGYATRKGNAVMYVALFIGIIDLCFGIAMGWLDYWVLLIICLLAAIMLASSLRGLITGG
jgi:vacuolar-type H+-ATPase subunit I/STV1